jgi:tetratricopeptide (TPR) repeat protein/2-polyprenyl-3-methyl-5-hydroxy-6-metoxy-1,4-benzoquinol methylase
MQHHDAGRLDAAEASYREVLAADPGHPDALALLGDVADRRGRPDQAVMLLREAIQRRPSVAQLHHKLGTVLAQCGELDAACASYRAALRLKPDLPEAAFELGNALAWQGRRAEAIAAYRRALSTQPRHAPAQCNLALALQAEGRWDEALAAYRAALALEDMPEIRAHLARALMAAPRLPADAGMRALVARAIAEAWVRPADLARIAIGLLRAHPGLVHAIDAACAAWPRRLTARELLTAETLDACTEPLARALLAHAHASDRDLEIFLTAARHALLESLNRGADDAPAEATLPFACLLARQCFLGDYVFSVTREEEGRVDALERRLREAMDRGERPAPAALAVLGCYVALGKLPRAASLLEAHCAATLQAVLEQQVTEPVAEGALREALPTLTPIQGDVSLRVRQQYEENPYPRWTRLPDIAPLQLDSYLRMLLPDAALPPGRIAVDEILVAGCGTGQESVDFARQFPASRILALDLSRASLAYAARKTREAGCANVEYAQADITELECVERSFDLISCVGVLHHLSDPLAGWRALVKRLRPGGFMLVGLYSEIARRDIAAARAMIAERGYAPDAAGIRRCREAILADPAWQALTTLRDFYGLNECRDLLFHVQEHRTSLPALARTLDTVGLRFLGLAVAPEVQRRFALRFPQGPLADPLLWDRFEQENPGTFAGMYIFWVQKPPE